VLQRLREIADGGSRSADSTGKLDVGTASPQTQAESRMAAPFKPFVSPASTMMLEPRRAAESAPHPPSATTRTIPQSAVRVPPAPAPAAPAWRFLALAHGNYALFETAAGLVLLDRRAAHERVWFERLQEQFRTGVVPSQRLLLPVPLELDPIAAALLLDRLKFLNAHGFELAEFGRNFFRVEGVPVWMEPEGAEPFLRDLLGAFRDGHWPDRNPDLARDELARLAATKAVRLPERAGESELAALIAQLFATRTPLTSPAGRPTYIELNHGELARRFNK